MGSHRLEIRLLGRFSVRHGGEEVANEQFGGRLPRRLVRVLATRLDEVVTREILIGALWPRRAPADPDNNLSVLVNRARRAVGEPTLIDTVSGGYRLRAERCWVDVAEFRRLVAEGGTAVRDGHPATGLRNLLAALELWGEPFPEDTYEEWSQPARRALFAEHQAALEGAADAALLVHQPVQAAALAQHAVAEEPLRERAHLLLVRALATSGDRAGALAALGALRRALADELGIDPSAEAANLERQVLEGDAPHHPAEHRIRRQPTPRAPFVGRRAELERLSWLTTDGHRVAIIEGVAGSGKSRLLEQLTRGIDVPVLTARAFSPESATPWALARSVLAEAVGHDIGAAARLPPPILRALSDLVLPELADHVAAPGGELEHETRRVLALEGAVRLLTSAAAGGALLAVDDLQWADATSLEVLALAVARIDTLLLVVAHRPPGPREDVAAFLAELRPVTDTLSVEVGRLALDEIAEITGEAHLARLLDEDTDGTPFAVTEVLKHLAGSAAGSDRHDDAFYAEARRAARDGKRRSVLSRVARQGPQARRLLQLMAVLGREASAALLARAVHQPHPLVLEILDHLARDDLVHLGERGWAAAHDLIAESVLDDLDRSDRGQLHLLLADALTDDDHEPGERAHHLQGAGDTRAAAAFARAARDQVDRHAHPEAERLAQAGLDVARDDEVRSRLLAVRAEVRTHDGNLHGAREDLRDALARTLDGPHRALLLTRSAALAVATGDLEQASRLVDLALLDASEDTQARARALALGSIVDMNGLDAQRAERRASEAQALYEHLGDAAGVADILDARAMATFLDGDIRDGVDAFDRVARLFTDSGNLLRAVTPRSTRGHGLVFLDDPARGLVDTEAALHLARTLGHPDGQAFALWHRSEALGALGRLDEAMANATEALAIAQRVGHRGWTATAWRATGLVHEATGDHQAALDAYRHSLQAGQTVPLFACWGNARLSVMLLQLGDEEAAARHAQQAVAQGPPLGQYEARLAEATVAVHRDDHDAPRLISTARKRAIDGGHLASARALSSLER